MKLNNYDEKIVETRESLYICQHTFNGIWFKIHGKRNFNKIYYKMISIRNQIFSKDLWFTLLARTKRPFYVASYVVYLCIYKLNIIFFYTHTRLYFWLCWYYIFFFRNKCGRLGLECIYNKKNASSMFVKCPSARCIFWFVAVRVVVMVVVADFGLTLVDRTVIWLLLLLCR